MESAALREMYERFADIGELIAAASEPSLMSTFDDAARKAILVSSTSYFEATLSKIVSEFCRQATGHNALVPALVEAKAIKRQYHTWFDWKENTATTLFALFGPAFKAHMAQVLRGAPELEDQISAFMELGRERNRLVHVDYATYTVEKTSRELFETYLLALEFVRQVPVQLNACAAALAVQAADQSGGS